MGRKSLGARPTSDFLPASQLLCCEKCRKHWKLSSLPPFFPSLPSLLSCWRVTGWGRTLITGSPLFFFSLQAFHKQKFAVGKVAWSSSNHISSFQLVHQFVWSCEGTVKIMITWSWLASSMMVRLNSSSAETASCQISFPWESWVTTFCKLTHLSYFGSITAALYLPILSNWKIANRRRILVAYR